ncbi:MAG: hypothetical protein ABI698_09095 [bacterium]
MIRSLVALTVLLLSINGFPQGARPQRDSTLNSAEQEIRAALCDIDGGDFATAEKKLEKLLQSNPRNIHAQRLLFVALTRQVKPGDRSPGNTALARKAEAARKRSEVLSATLETGRKAKADREERNNEQALRKPEANEQPDDPEQLTEELTDYKVETSLDLDQAIEDRITDAELSSLVAPVFAAPASGDTTRATVATPSKTPQGCFREIDGLAQVLEKREWKSFSPAGEDVSVELPDNLCSSIAGSYIAASDGVMYSIFSLARPSLPSEPTVVDGVLNTLARTFVGARSRTSADEGNSFEVKLLRKEAVNGRPSKVYEYALISCAKRKAGVLFVYAGKTHYYTVDISGANESDPRVQRFLKSVRFR